jgi:transcriptional regulator with XRE-family HTH domain
MTLAQRVRDQRYAKGWGPDELASRASISRTALYQIESGKTEQPRAATLRRIAQALDIPTEALLGPHLGIVPLGWTNPESSQGQRVAEPHHVPVRLRIDEPTSIVRTGELDRKFHEVLASPLGEGVARIVEETHRILPHALAEAGW